MKNKYLGVAWVGVAMLLLGFGGFFLWQKVHANDSSMSYGAEAGVGNSTSSSSDNLSVGASNSATDLGQLGNGGGQNPVGQGTQTGTGSSASSSSGPSWPDPSTFSAYDKYKDSQGALFGDVVVGNGAALGNDQKAAVYYKGFLTNGQIFDQSKADSSGKLQPFVFTEGAHQVIPGWEEGVSGMKVGGSRLIIVPPSAGYGAQGQGSIPPNSVLVFEVQLLQVQ